VSSISDNVGGVKHFLSTLPHPLEEERHFALSEKQLPLPTNVARNQFRSEFDPTYASLRSQLRS
jgi:hypothetical protein